VPSSDIQPSWPSRQVLVVVGAPRGGVSDATGLLVASGLVASGHVVSDPEAQLPEDRAPRLSLGGVADRIDGRILAHVGGSRDRPPRLELGWEHDPSLDDLAAQARTALSTICSVGPSPADPGSVDSRPVLLGGPLLPITFAFWRRVLDVAPLAVLVVAEPDAVAAALAEHDGLGMPHGLALYEHYLHSALRALEGSRVLLARHADLRADPAGFAASVALLVGTGSPEPPDTGPALDASWSAAPPAPGSSLVCPPLLDEQRALAATLRANLGVHDPLGHLDCGPQSPWSAALLDAERDLDHVAAGLDWAVRQLEPLVRAIPQSRLLVKLAERTSNDVDDSTSRNEPDGKGPYPLNASEDRRAYHRWLTAKRLPLLVGGAGDTPVRRARTRPPARRREPLISLLVPVWRTPLWVLERSVGSVLAQGFADWELCLCDDASGDAELTAYLRSLQRVDRRIHTTALAENGGISAATNGALALARGRYVAFLDHDDELALDALEEVAEVLTAQQDVDVAYSDEDKIDASGERFDPLFKPDWSPDLLLSFQYIGHLTVVRRQLVVELGGLRSDYDGSQDYDLALRATERAGKIVHIPKVLYHWRTLPGSAASDASGTVAKPWAYEAGLRAIEDALARRGEAAEVTQEPRFAGRYHVRRLPSSEPLVSIVIPFRDEPGLLATCCTSLRADPGYERVELVLVDNGSELPETAALLDRLAAEPGVTVLASPGPFNWAALNNEAAREASGEILLFANNDIEARSSRWLHAMLGHALRPEVGAVGARLTYADGAIQHAGVVVGLGGIAGHVLRGLPGDHPGYNSMAIQTRNCSVVTGACMMTRRDVFDSVGGFDEDLPVAFNDVDYCLALREKGYLVVYTPLAELVHHESRSRGHTDDLAESRRILERWGHVIVAGDPYLNTNLSHWRYWCPLSTAQEDDRWKTYLETAVSTRARSSST